LHRAAANTTVPEVFGLLAESTDDPCAPIETGRTALDYADDNAALTKKPQYWRLHDRCSGQAQ
jgi:hypothetical protein